MQAFRTLVFLTAALLIATFARAQNFEWSPDFGRPAFTDAPSPRCIASARIGGGEDALYVGGSFTQIGGVTTNAIGKWEQSQWSAVGGGMSAGATVHAITSFDDDGAGPRPAVLIAGGTFISAGDSDATNIAMWDGSRWRSMGPDPARTDGAVYALTVFDDGRGPALYAAGNFNNMSGLEAAGVACWKDGAWTRLGTGIPVFGGFSAVRCLYGFNDGRGPGLFVGGTFSSAGGVPVDGVARWRNGRWSALPNGPSNGVYGAQVSSLTSFNGRLCAAGAFEFAGGAVVNNIAFWDGVRWLPAGAGLSGFGASIATLAVFDSGSGPSLYAGGFFWTAGGAPAFHIARWNGASWSTVGGGADLTVLSMCVHNRGDGNALYTTGSFSYVNGSSTDPGSVAAKFLARWTGTEWLVLGNGLSYLSSVAVHDFGSGPQLYVAGLARAGEQLVDGAARWDGHRWSSQGSVAGFGDFYPTTIVPYGGKLYYSGNFWTIGAPYSSTLVTWDGVNWAVPSGSLSSGFYYCTALGTSTVLGNKLYASGCWSGACGARAWDGTSWETVYANPLTSASPVFTFLGVVDSQGPAIYMGTRDLHLGYALRFDGSTLTALGIPPNWWVNALAQFDDGTGPAIYAGGSFGAAGGAPAFGIAKWNGTAWSPVGAGFNGTCHALTVFDDGSGPALYAGGRFTHTGSMPISNIAKWNGTTWSALGTGISGPPGTAVYALVPYDDGSGPALYAGGNFTTAGGFGSHNIACWRKRP